MSKPETLFCKVLENSFETTISNIEAALAIPSVILRGIKSNIQRAESIVLSRASEQLDAIEEKIIQILMLRKINESSGVNNWCQIAYACEALKQELYNLPSLPSEVKDYINGSYGNFERNVCKLGFRKIINTFFNDIFSKLIEQLDALSENLIDQLKIYELESKYLEALNSYKMPLPEPFDLTLEELITKLTYFTNCAFEVCNWAETASNKLTDIEEKNYIKYTGVGIQTALSPLYTGFEVKRNSLQERIDYLKGVCDVQNIDDRIPRDTIMDF